RYDLSGLTKHFGRMCGLIGLVLLLSGIAVWLEREVVFTLLTGSMFLILPIFLFGSERYIMEGRKKQRIINIVITVFMGVVAVFVIAMVLIGSKAPVIYIDDENLVIESMYGIELPIDSIEQIERIDLTGKKISKLNGFDAGDIRKGRFSVEDLGRVTVFQQGKTGEFISIQTDEDIILIDLGSKDANRDLESLIRNAQKN
ncbi:MAG: PH domain-containing protein, partial [Bacillota bacterium]